MIEDVNPAAHPRVNVTSQLNWPSLRIGDETVFVLAAGARENIELVPVYRGRRSHVMIGWITIGEGDRFARQNRGNPRHECVVLLVHGDALVSCGNGPRL